MNKSPATGAILGLLFGGFGLFYLGAGTGFSALGLSVLLGVLTGGALVPIIWIGCGVWGYFGAKSHNERLQIAASQTAASTPANTSNLPVNHQLAPGKRIAKDLMKLRSLHEAGVLDDSEFVAKKAALIEALMTERIHEDLADFFGPLTVLVKDGTLSPLEVKKLKAVHALAEV